MNCYICNQPIKAEESRFVAPDGSQHHILCFEGTERSGAAQRCLPSPTGSAPERSGGAETDGDYLRRSAPVERFSAVVAEWKGVVKSYGVLYADALAKKRRDFAFECLGKKRMLMACIYQLEKLLAENSAQCNGPKAESVAKPRRRSGAQARNAKPHGHADNEA